MLGIDGEGVEQRGKTGNEIKKLYIYLDVTGQQGVFHTRQMP